LGAIQRAIGIFPSVAGNISDVYDKLPSLSLYKISNNLAAFSGPASKGVSDYDS
jgi:hypothetical protein